jgi:metal-responsive CopG/Arc/MetJ family transcriptional regulator
MTTEVLSIELKGSRTLGLRIPNRLLVELDQHLAIGVTRNKLITIAVREMLERRRAQSQDVA